MGRELKIRIWSKKDCIYLDPSWIHLASDGRHLIEHDLGQYSHLDDSFILQQFTGLLDKNGKDIYEGDILIFRPSYEESLGGQLSAELGEVYWDTDGWHWLNQYLNENSGAIEIIGNIFENPELL